jgi:hypothetical protein
MSTMPSSLFPNMDPMQPVQPSFHPSTATTTTPTTHTTEPKIVGTSVLAMKYDDGIVLAADNLGNPPSGLVLCVLCALMVQRALGVLRDSRMFNAFFPLGRIL